MEDETGLPRKKRGVMDSPNLDRPSKKANTDYADPPVSSWDENTLRYQSRSMINKIQLLRQDIGGLNSKVSKLESQLLQSDEKMAVADQSWKQLHENLKGILLRLEQGKHIESLKPYESKKNSTKEFTNYLSSMVKRVKGEEEEVPSEELSSFLDERNKAVASILTSIVEAFEERNIVNQNLCAQLKSETTDEQVKSLTIENERLRTELNLIKQSNDELKAKNNELVSKENSTQRANNKLRDQIEQLKSDLLDAKDASEDARKKLIRIQNQSAEDLDRLRSDFNSYKANSALNPGSEIKTEEKPLLSVKSEESNGVSKDSFEEIAELTATLQNRNENITRLESERENMIKELEYFKAELHSLPIQRVAATRHYQQLQSQLAYVQGQLDTTRRDNDALVAELRAEKMKSNDERERLIAQYEKERASRDISIKNREEDLNRYRREREELRHKLKSAESSNFSKSSVATMQTILDAQEKECKRLRNEVLKYKEDSDKLKTFNEDTKRQHEKLTDTISQRDYDIQDLKSKLRDADKMISNMRRDKKDWEERESQYKMVIEVFQRETKEKRDVREIRVSEQKLKEENIRLEMLLEKYERGAVVNGVPADLSMSNSLLKEAEARIADLESQRRDLSRRCVKADEIAKESQAELEKSQSSLSIYVAEMDEITKAYDDSQEMNKKIAAQLIEKEDALTSFISESIRKDHIQEAKNIETQVLKERITTLENRIVTQEELNLSSENRIKVLTSDLKRNEDEFKKREEQFNIANRNTKDRLQELTESKVNLDRLEKELEGFKARIQEKTKEADKYMTRNGRLESDMERMKKRFEKHKLGANEEDKDDLYKDFYQVHRWKVFCTVCQTNQKDCCITKCGHTFCRQCIQKKLDLRSRKCPTCNKVFSESEVQSIWLTE